MSSNEEYVRLLSEGVMQKRYGKYEEAKQKYIEAIHVDSNNPTAYYNLGKLMYITGDLEASIRSYKIAFELGVDPYNLFIHLGHSLIDKENKNNEWKDVVSFYERGINPAIIKKYMNDLEGFNKIMSINPSKSQLDKYEKMCIEAAKKYLEL